MEFLIGGHVAEFRRMLDEIKAEIAELKEILIRQTKAEIAELKETIRLLREDLMAH